MMPLLSVKHWSFSSNSEKESVEQRVGEMGDADLRGKASVP